MTETDAWRCSCARMWHRQCIQRWLTVCINDGLERRLTCLGCHRDLSADEVKELVPPEVFSKYEKFLHVCEIKSDPARKFCPTPGCDGVLSLQAATSRSR